MQVIDHLVKTIRAKMLIIAFDAMFSLSLSLSLLPSPFSSDQQICQQFWLCEFVSLSAQTCLSIIGAAGLHLGQTCQQECESHDIKE